MIALTILMIILAYLAGSLSSAIIIARMYQLPDPRINGSGNPGATNILRIGGARPAILVLIGDVLKGTITVWCSYFLGLEPLSLGLVAVAACLGHIFPIFFEFKGGKGVATAFGAMLPIGLDLTGLLLLSWLAVVLITGYSSVAALVVSLLAPVLTYLIKPQYTIAVTLLCLLIMIRHQPNMVRLLNGQESKIWQKFKRKK